MQYKGKYIVKNLTINQKNDLNLMLLKTILRNLKKKIV